MFSGIYTADLCTIVCKNWVMKTALYNCVSPWSVISLQTTHVSELTEFQLFYAIACNIWKYNVNACLDKC